MSKQTEIKFKADDYGGIEAVELNYRNDCVYIDGNLEDGYDSIADFLEYNKKELYDSVLECAKAMEGK